MKIFSSEDHNKLVSPFRSRQSSLADQDLVGKFDMNHKILGKNSFPGVKEIYYISVIGFSVP